MVASAGCSRDPQVRKQRYFDKGTAYFQQAKYREATIEFENALQIDPKFADAHYQLALCYLKQGALQRAYQELARTVDLAPGNQSAQIDLATLLLAGGKASDARDHAETVLEADPQNAPAQVILSEADARLGDLPKAITEAQQAIQMNVARPASYVNLALLQQKNNDAAAAERNLQKALALDPKSVSVTTSLAEFYQGQRRWGDAEKQFRAAIGLDPRNPALRTALVNLYLAEGRKDLAEQTLQDAKNSPELKDNPAAYRMLGGYYLSQGQLDKASTEFASLYDEHPKDSVLAKTYAEVLMLQNRLDEATRINDAVLQNSPADYDAQVLRGQILTRQGKASDAIPILEAAVKSAPDNPLGHYHLGTAYAAAGNFEQAQSQWLQAAKLRPDMVEPERALAEYALRSGNTSLLADSSEELIRIEPRSDEGFLFHATALFKRGDATGTEQDLKKAMEIAPQDPAPETHMGDLRAAEKQFAEAAKYYNRALALDPASPEALAGLINVDLEQKQPTVALRLVKDQITKVPDKSALYYLLGQVELRNQDSAAAEQALQKAVDLDKNNVPAFALLARVQVSRGSVDQAIANYQRALDANPRDVHLYVAIGGLLESRGEWQKAQDLYQKALQIQPDYAVAANNEAYLMLEHGGDTNTALSLAQTGRRGLPNLGASADTLGWAYYHEGVYNAAVDMLQQAVKEDDKNPTYHYHLGLAYQKASDYAMARKQLESALQINPNYSQADAVRKALSQLPQQN
jgi:tetratricopeptide (TPR) repeat protein